MKKNSLLSLLILSLMAASQVHAMGNLLSLRGQVLNIVPGTEGEIVNRESAGLTLAALGGYDLLTNYFSVKANPLLKYGSVIGVNLAAMYVSKDYEVVSRGVSSAVAWGFYSFLRNPKTTPDATPGAPYDDSALAGRVTDLESTVYSHK